MNKIKDKIFKNIILVLTVFTLSILLFIFYFLIKEALPLFSSYSLKDFLFGTRWMPITFANIEESFGIWYFILGTLYVSIVAIFIALFFSVGISIILSFSLNERIRKYIFILIDMIAGIPSVVFGFFGLQVLSPLFFKMGIKTGNCILLGAIVLSIMILPFMINTISNTMLYIKRKYYISVSNLGIDKWYFILTIVLPESFKSIILSLILANCRAMGETMAVMMVIGNAKIFPHLLAKGETIASLIALEMGTAVRNSNHYHALYAAGLVLLVLTFITNQIVYVVGRKKDEDII